MAIFNSRNTSLLEVLQKYFAFYQPLTNHKCCFLVGCTTQITSESSSWALKRWNSQSQVSWHSQELQNIMQPRTQQSWETYIQVLKNLETSSRHPVPHVHCASPNSGEFPRMLPFLNEMCALFKFGKNHRIFWFPEILLVFIFCCQYLWRFFICEIVSDQN